MVQAIRVHAPPPSHGDWEYFSPWNDQNLIIVKFFDEYELSSYEPTLTMSWVAVNSLFAYYTE